MKPLPKWVHYPLILGAICAASGGLLSWIYSITHEGIERSRKVEAMRAIAAVAFGRALGSTRAAEKEGKALIELLDGDGETLGCVEDKGSDCYVVFDREQSLKGYAAVARGRGSYNTMNPVKILTVLGPELDTILGARVAESAETPGLGEKAKEIPASYSIFGSLTGAPRKELVVTKDGRSLAGDVTVREDGTVVVETTDGEKHAFAPNECWRGPRAPRFMEQFSGLRVQEAKLSADGGKVDAITGATVTSRAVISAVSDAAGLLRVKFRKP